MEPILPVVPKAKVTGSAGADPTTSRQLEQTIDEWSQSRSFRDDEDQAEGHEQDHDGREPPLLAHAQEAPEFFQDRELFVHLELFFVAVGRGRFGTALPITALAAPESNLKWALSAKALNEADRGDDQKEEDRQNYAVHDPAEKQRENHPRLVNVAQGRREKGRGHEQQGSEREEKAAGFPVIELQERTEDEQGDSEGEAETAKGPR